MGRLPRRRRSLGPGQAGRSAARPWCVGPRWAYGGEVMVDDDLNLLSGSPPPSPEELAAALGRYNAVPGSASNVIVDSELLARVGPFDEGLRRTADWDMWLRLVATVRPACVERPVVAIRVHPGNISRDMETMFREIDVIAARYRIPVDRARHSGGPPGPRSSTGGGPRRSGITRVPPAPVIRCPRSGHLSRSCGYGRRRRPPEQPAGSTTLGPGCCRSRPTPTDRSSGTGRFSASALAEPDRPRRWGRGGGFLARAPGSPPGRSGREGEEAERRGMRTRSTLVRMKSRSGVPWNDPVTAYTAANNANCRSDATAKRASTRRATNAVRRHPGTSNPHRWGESISAPIVPMISGSRLGTRPRTTSVTPPSVTMWLVRPCACVKRNHGSHARMTMPGASASVARGFVRRRSDKRMIRYERCPL